MVIVLVPGQGKVCNSKGSKKVFYLCIPYFLEIYNLLKGRVIGTKNTEFGLGYMSLSGTSFVIVTQVYADKTAMTLEPNALMGYHIHPVRLISLRVFSWLMVNGHSVIGILTVDIGKILKCYFEADITLVQGLTSNPIVGVESFVLHTSQTSHLL